MTEAFGIRGGITLTASGYCYGNGSRYEIWCYSAVGEPELVTRRVVEPVRVTAEAIEGFKNKFKSIPVEQGMADNQGFRDHLARLADAMPFASTFPVHRRFRFDPLGFLWVKNYDLQDDLARRVDAMGLGVRESPAEWSVFDPTGQWLGDVTLPAGFFAIQFDRDGILGISHDADDLEQVLFLRLDRR